MATGLPTVVLATPPEPFAPVELATGCDRTDKAGVLAFRDFILSTVGGRDLGIDRPCEVGKASEHHEHRAWDWGLLASNPADASRADAVLDWLLAADAANFRRAGLMYLIWNEQIWSTTYREWRPYTGASPHTDHVHFSFGWPGARGETSLFAWLRGLQPPGPGPGPTPKPVPAVSWGGPLAIAAGAVVGFWGARRIVAGRRRA